MARIALVGLTLLVLVVGTFATSAELRRRELERQLEMQFDREWGEAVSRYERLRAEVGYALPKEWFRDSEVRDTGGGGGNIIAGPWFESIGYWSRFVVLGAQKPWVCFHLIVEREREGTGHPWDIRWICCAGASAGEAGAFLEEVRRCCLEVAPFEWVSVDSVAEFDSVVAELDSEWDRRSELRDRHARRTGLTVASILGGGVLILVVIIGRRTRSPSFDFAASTP